MIKLRINPLSSDERDIPFKSSETIQRLVERALSLHNVPVQEEVLKSIVVHLNGEFVHPEFWPKVLVLPESEITIAIRPRGGDFGQTFKSLALVSVAVTMSVLFPPSAGADMALLGAAITVASGFALNMLIPPPTFGGGGAGGANSYEDSQMFSITGQSNQIKKYGKVPKVYGRHRVFPNVAATPFIELEPNEDGDLEQHLYAIYDFGVGTNVISDIRIGETPLADFTNVYWNIVDPNQPETWPVEYDPWENGISNEFILYLSDVASEQFSVSLTGNVDAGDSPDTYRVIRNIPDPGAVTSEYREVSVLMTCPQGIFSFDTQGNRGYGEIDLQLEYRVEGDSTWLPVSQIGIDSLAGNRGTTEYLGLSNTDRIGGGFLLYNPTISAGVIDGLTLFSERTIVFPGNDVDLDRQEVIERIYGLPAFGTSYLNARSDIAINSVIKYGGQNLGRVISKQDFGAYYRYGIETGIVSSGESYSSRDIYLFKTHSTNRWTPLVPMGMYVIDAFNRYKNFTVESYTNNTSFQYTYPHTFFNIKGAVQSARYAMVRFKLYNKKPTQIRLTRYDTRFQYSYQTEATLVLSAITAKAIGSKPINTDKRHTFLELKIKATDQLNGTIDTLSAISSSVLDYYDTDTSSWSKKETNNPAWVFSDILSNPQVNKKAISKDRLDISSLSDWATYCDEIPPSATEVEFLSPRYTSNFVLDFGSTVQDLLNNVSNAAQASLNLVGGKYGVLLDKKKTTPVQVFTPRNSWGFSSSRKFYEPPNRLLVKYIEPEQDWQQVEVAVYNDGYDANNWVTEESLETFACTDYEQAWRAGRYWLAQTRLRQEQMSLYVDFEHLVCTRGDYVRIVQDVMKVGGAGVRVKSVSGSDITIDAKFLFDPAKTYNYIFRGVNGITEEAGITITSSTTATLAGDIPSVGDLLVYGEVAKVYYDCIVKSIAPASDESASISLVEKADGIFDAESGADILTYNPQISDVVIESDTAPPLVTDLEVADNSWRCAGLNYEYYIQLLWDIPITAVYDIFEIYANNELVGFSKSKGFEYVVPESSLGSEISFKVLAVSTAGQKKDLGQALQVSATPTEKTSAPSDVEAVYLNVTGEVLQIEWPLIPDCDSSLYLIRYSPSTTGASWDTSIPLLNAARNINMVTTQARTGTYLIKAVDFNDNESDTAAAAITTIPQLFNLNVIEETNDFPALTGVKERVVDNGSGELTLKPKQAGGVETNEYYSEGFYYYDAFLDLGDIYSVRLQSSILAQGFTVSDLMANWITLADVEVMAAAKYSEWDVETYCRTSDYFDVIADWASLSDIDFMSQGAQENWSEWRKFTIGDFTGRLFQFRLRLVSYKASVTPLVIDGEIKADMPDRVDSYNNISAPDTGYTLTYNPKFAGPSPSPTIQITMDDGETGDYWKITSKSLEGFTIRFYNKDNIAVARQFDAMIRGYGRKSTSSI